VPSDDEATRGRVGSAQAHGDGAPPLPGDPGDGPTDAPLLGQTIAGRYRVTALLAAGGMGSVYLAEHLQLRKRVAVKVLRPDTDNYGEMAARFEREAIAGAHVVHPNVVSAFDFDQLEDGSCFLVLEYVRGVTLHELLRRGPLPTNRAVFIASQVAAALGAAHAMGVLHRDVKPRNIMLVEPDRRVAPPRTPGERARPRRDMVKLIDFGLCKVPLDRISTVGMETRKADALTAKGVVFGTPPYMAPEASLGMEHVDHRADLYALGIVLYRMLAGRHPFDATTETEHILANRVMVPPPIRLRAPGVDVPREVEAVVMRLLAKDVRARHADADELIDALERAAPQSPVEADWIPWTAPLPLSVAGASLADPPDVSAEELHPTRAEGAAGGGLLAPFDAPSPMLSGRAPLVAQSSAPPAMRRSGPSVWFWVVLALCFVAGVLVALVASTSR
jgi:serine/threonine-protein kinase